jgi:redox-sensitive bicupin YhaK (pirin superfamily)
MKHILYPANERGTNDIGWLKANFSFSFGPYYNPDKVHFGALRVLNDDIIAAGTGFGSHPHDNMEIITIPLEGALEHKDSMGNIGVIHAGEVQVMSAGTGITPGNGAYIFIIEGAAKINGQVLNKRDAIGVYDTNLLIIETEAFTRLLIMDIPML